MRRVEVQYVVVCLLMALVSAGLPVNGAAQATEPPNSGLGEPMRFVPNVVEQFGRLTEHPDPMGFRRGGSPDPSSCRHYQAMVRVNGPDGTPFFIVTRSGNTPPLSWLPDEIACDDSDNETRNGHLIVFRMGSRDKNGERLRGNRLARGTHMEETMPPAEDAASIYYTVTQDGLVPFDGEGPAPPQRGYQHPGGMQLVGKMLAVALETPREFGYGSDYSSCLQDPTDNPACERYYGYQRAATRTLIQFYDVSDPEHPRLVSDFVPVNAAKEVLFGAGVLGITPLPNGQYLMMATGGQNTTLFFYRSKGTDLGSEALDWDYLGSTPGVGTANAHQTMQFLREGDINGPLFLAGARGRFFSDDRDRIDLYRVHCGTVNCDPGAGIELENVRFGQRIIPFAPTRSDDELVSLAAGSDFYISSPEGLM